MRAAKYDFSIQQGADLDMLFRRRDSTGQLIPMVGFHARLQARQNYESAQVLLDLSTQYGGIEIDGPAGSFRLVMTANQTAALAWRRAKYDLEITDSDGAVRRLLEGFITISREITRD